MQYNATAGVWGSPSSPVSYHVTGFEDPEEGEVLIGLAERSGNSGDGGVLQGGPPHVVEPGETLPLQLLHPQLLTCDGKQRIRVTGRKPPTWPRPLFNRKLPMVSTMRSNCPL